MENQAEVVETLVDPDDEENIANSSYRIDEASETNTDVPRTVPGINLGKYSS